MNKNCIGKEYPSFSYQVSVEKIREYARSTLMDNPLYFDLEFARNSMYGTLIAPPTFAAVYCLSVFESIFYDPELELNIPRVVHGEQEFRFGEIVRSGDVITTKARIDDIYSKETQSGIVNQFIIIHTTSINQTGNVVCEGLWTLVERGEKMDD